MRTFQKEKDMREKSDIVNHSGTVVSIDTEKIRIIIEANSACGACAAKGLCNMGERKEKILDVYKKDGGEHGEDISGMDIKVGDKVQVGVVSYVAMKAVRIAYLYPFILLVVMFFVFGAIGLCELWQGLLSCLMVVVYAFILYILSKKNMFKHIRFFLVGKEQ